MAEVWELDVDAICLDDMIALQEGSLTKENLRQFKEILGRLISNKTEEEIGKMPLRDLKTGMDSVTAKITEMMTVPKANDTP